jgi:hypothetical protein
VVNIEEEVNQMRTVKNFKGARLTDCSGRSATDNSLFTMMSTLPAKELELRISKIKDQDTRVLAQAHMNALADDWDGPIKE